MDRKKVFVCALFGALVVSFALAASAQDWDEAVDDTDTPYIDAEGNFDIDMAKEYAEVVDSYVDEKGVAWDVWLDDVGGIMWYETAEMSSAEDGAVSMVDGSGTQLLLVFGDVPNYLKVWHHAALTGYYTQVYNYYATGYIEYWESCGTNCAKWWVWDYAGTPSNVTKIEGRASSFSDYCDGTNNDYYYGAPDFNWIIADEDSTCWTVGPTLTYYYSRGDGLPHVEYGPENHRMIRWDYHISGTHDSTRVFWGGVDPI